MTLFSFCSGRSICNMTLTPSISSHGLLVLFFCLLCVFRKDPCMCLFYFGFPLQLMERCQLELQTEIGGVSCMGNLGSLHMHPGVSPEEQCECFSFSVAVTRFTLCSPWFCREGLSSHNWSAHTVHSSLHSELRRPDSALSCAVCFAAAKAEVVPSQQVSVAGVWRGRGVPCFFAIETHSSSWVRSLFWSNLAPCFSAPLFVASGISLPHSTDPALL